MKNKLRVDELLKTINFGRIEEFVKGKATPCLAVDLDIVNRSYTELEDSMPGARIFFAMKACPLDEVIKLVASRGGNFDAASPYEIEQLLRLGISGDRISFGNTIKKECDIAFAYKNGIRIFTTDSESDLKKIARVAPGSKVNLRILMEGGDADWALSRKFGSHTSMTYDLAIYAKGLGLIPYGISFHVGSQQRTISQWNSALSQTESLFVDLKEIGIELKCINIGGGFPANYLKETQPTKEYGDNITGYIKEYFPTMDLDIIVEPGRSLTANAGIIAAEVVLVSKKSKDDNVRWVFLDVGKFSGLPETEGEAIKYPILFPNHCGENETYGEVILAGNTCDSADILYEKERYRAPMSLKDGDIVYILTTGAYTSSYSAIGFNGFPPLTSFALPLSTES